MEQAAGAHRGGASRRHATCCNVCGARKSRAQARAVRGVALQGPPLSPRAPQPAQRRALLRWWAVWGAGQCLNKPGGVLKGEQVLWVYVQREDSKGTALRTLRQHPGKRRPAKPPEQAAHGPACAGHRGSTERPEPLAGGRMVALKSARSRAKHWAPHNSTEAKVRRKRRGQEAAGAGRPQAHASSSVAQMKPKNGPCKTAAGAGPLSPAAPLRRARASNWKCAPDSIPSSRSFGD